MCIRDRLEEEEVEDDDLFLPEKLEEADPAAATPAGPMTLMSWMTVEVEKTWSSSMITLLTSVREEIELELMALMTRPFVVPGRTK